jgi:hypothetical protein
MKNVKSRTGMYLVDNTLRNACGLQQEKLHLIMKYYWSKNSVTCLTMIDFINLSEWYVNLIIIVKLIDYEELRLCLRTAHTEPIIHPPGDM